MGELLNALTPYPMALGIAIGLIIAAIGVWAMRKGMQERAKETPIEDVKARWETHGRIGHIHENSFEIVKLLEKANDIAELQLAALNRLFDTRWNKHQ